MVRWLLMLGLGWLLMWPAAVQAEPLTATPATPAQLFELHCAGCHPGGGNIIRRGKSLQQRALTRYKVDSTTEIAALITQGKGVMSAFGDRLDPAEIEALSQYVLEQAAAGWPPA
jgi:cytochrome c6